MNPRRKIQEQNTISPQELLSKTQILFEDDNLIVINKPAGVLTIPDRYNQSLPSLSSFFKKKYGKIYIVHRLDRETSGIMIFAKDAETHRSLSIDFENSDIIRKYLVIVEGVFPQDNLEIDIPLRPSRKKVGMTVPSAKGKPSLTRVNVIEKFRSATLLECELVTGRHHQIRVHLQSVGYPLLVDELYGNKNEFFVSFIKKKFNLKKGSKELPIISRLTMHSKLISFVHPATKEKMLFEADTPKDLSALINVLEKYSTLKI